MKGLRAGFFQAPAGASGLPPQEKNPPTLCKAFLCLFYRALGLHVHCLKTSLPQQTILIPALFYLPRLTTILIRSLGFGEVERSLARRTRRGG